MAKKSNRFSGEDLASVTPSPKPRFFQDAAAFRAWLAKHHRTARELVVGFYKKHTGRPSIDWPESVAEALCFGWIDGIRRRHGADAYTIRFTPRRPGGHWSVINVRLIGELEAAGKMTDAGRAAFDARRHKSGPHAAGYTTTGRTAEWDPSLLAEFKAHRPAWQFFTAQPPGYRNLAAWWVMTAKQNATRKLRLANFIITFSARTRLC